MDLLKLEIKKIIEYDFVLFWSLIKTTFSR